MRKKNIKSYIKASACITMISLLTGCTGNFEDYNMNPFGPTPDDLLGDNVETGILIEAMLPAIVQGHQNNSQMIDQMIGLEYGGHASMINPWGNSGNYYTYNPRVSWYGTTFDTTMPQIYSNFFQIKEKTGGKGVVFAWAQILRVAASLKISDCYGPIPYSKINGTAYTVSYDNMEELYNNMFADLDEAILTIKAALASNADVSILANYDFVYSGNFTKWVKYANTLKLRMAMRIANVSETVAKKKAEEAVHDNIGVMTEAGDAAYSSYNDGMNPFYRASYTWNGGEFRVSANITSYMNGYKDPRLALYFKESEKNGYAGVRNGISQTASSFASYQTLSKPNIGENDKLLIMSAAEAYFLRAEGKLKGWDMGGTAKDLYETGIITSMTEKGTTVGDYLSNTLTPADYTDPINSKYSYKAVSTVCPAYDAGAGNDVNLERILVQKWIATYPSGWETWADIRRTGYPKFFPVGDNLSGGVVNSARGMRRLPYPQSEYNTNSTNVTAAVSMLGGGDNAGTDLWWAKKN